MPTTDQVLHYDLQTFKNMIHHGFAQHMQISQQNFIQILVVKANILQFISFDSDELFTVKLTPSVITLNRLFQSIIEKEREFLDQIKAFQRMLETSQILSTEPSPDQISTPSVKKAFHFRHFFSI